MAEWPFGHLKMFGYDFAMIDPPWPFELYSEKGNAKSPEAQYETMTLEQIFNLPVGQLVRGNGLVWCWFTWPLMAQGVNAEILKRWGLRGVTGGDWAKRTKTGKLRWGPGYVMRSVLEPFVLMNAGGSHDFIGPDVSNLIETIIEILDGKLLDGLAREHSRKPEEAYAIVDHILPSAFKCDVFSRQNRPGWDCFGKEAGKFNGNV